MNWLRKIKHKFESFFYSMFYGMKITEDEILHQQGTGSSEGVSISKHVEDQRVAKHLLKGEITQEVKELRYRTYLVDGESKNMEYYAPTLVMKQENRDSKFFVYDKRDGLRLVTSQSNDDIVQTEGEVFASLTDGAVTDAEFKPEKRQKRVIILRSGICRYKLENFITRVDVKETGDEHLPYQLDLFVSKYPSEFSFASKGFVNEIKRIFNGEVRNSDILDFETLSFSTHCAINLPNRSLCDFTNFTFREIVEFDGHYIIRLWCKGSILEMNLQEKYYDERMDRKYKEKARKDKVLDLSDFSTEAVTYTCHDCGKTCSLDFEHIDNVGVGEEIDGGTILEAYDYRIAMETFGYPLCADCMIKHLADEES